MRGGGGRFDQSLKVIVAACARSAVTLTDISDALTSLVLRTR
jgi:hypothetical protein